MTVDIERGDYNLINTMADSEPQHEAYTINRCLEKDDDNEFKKIIEKHKGNDVSQPCIPSYLHKAAEKGALKCLQFLLDILSSPDILDLPDDYSRTPLMVAVAKAQPRAVEMLLKAGAHVNARNNKGQSSLHLLVFALQRGVLSEEALQEIVDLLLKHENIDLEPHSDSNLTPLATAITRMPEEDGAPQKSSLITFCKKLVKVGASLKASAGDGTVEEVLQKKRALTSILMEIILPPAPSRPFTSEFLDMIILGKSTDEIKDFLINKDARIAVNYRLGSQTLLFRAVDKGDEELVKYLLATGANSWASEVTGELPIFRAVARSNYKILDHLINYMKLNNKVDLQRYTLTLIQKLMESAKKAKDCTPEESQSKCLERLLKSDVLLNLNQVPEDGKTPLHVAANFNNQETLSALLSHGAFLGARRTVKGKNKGHVLKALHPSTLKSAMDDCISFHPENSDVEEAENVLGENYTLDLDYRFLVPPVNKDKKTEDESKNEMETLMEISKSKVHRKAIKHPLVRALLFAKWHKALPLYIFNVSIYLFFVSILTAFVYNLKDLRILEVRQDNTLNSERNNSTLAEDILCKQSTVNILRGFLIPAAIYIVIKEVFQIVFSHNMYLKNIENYLQWFLVIVVFVLSFTPLDADVTRHLAAWTMIIAWNDSLSEHRFPQFLVNSSKGYCHGNRRIRVFGSE
ncbi:hypothetical protein SK128_002806 [Halocaridina rubra]|uniref:Uncharacterized protein n=1 Tax=Halocaridina rubra TaxID=373956 RepID=A0AAN8WU11_HALRR